MLLYCRWKSKHHDVTVFNSCERQGLQIFHFTAGQGKFSRAEDLRWTPQNELTEGSRVVFTQPQMTLSLLLQGISAFSLGGSCCWSTQGDLIFRIYLAPIYCCGVWMVTKHRRDQTEVPSKSRIQEPKSWGVINTYCTILTRCDPRTRMSSILL